MAEAPRGRVTITLGRSGQVVKMPGPVQGGYFTDSVEIAGTKRSVRDRLGSNVDSEYENHFNNKRQRGDVGMSSLSGTGFNDMGVGKNDLRYKLLQKDAMRRTRSENGKQVDLREKLSKPKLKTAQHPIPSPDLRQPVPQLQDPRMMSKVSSTRTADDFRQMDSYRNPYTTWTLDHLRRRSPDRILGAPRGLSPQRNVEKVQRRGLSSPRSVEQLQRRGHSPARNVEQLQRRDRSPPRNVEQLLRRGLSPQRNVEQLHRRGLSPQRNVEQLQRTTLNRSYDNVRSGSYFTKDVHHASMPMNTALFMTNSTPPPVSAKPAASVLSQLPPSSVLGPKNPYAVEERQTVDGLLHLLGLGKYAILFKAEEVDMTALKQMGENDLKEIGIPMGPRKKLLLALAPRAKRQA